MEHRPVLDHETSWFSKFTFSYVNPLVETGIRRTLEFEDLSELKPELKLSSNYPEFKKLFSEVKTKNSERAALGKTIARFLKKDFMKAILLAGFGAFFEAAIPIFIKLMISWLSEPNPKMYLGAIYAGIISFCAFLKIILNRRSFFLASLMQLKVGMVIRGIIFEKVSKLSS